MDLEGNTGHTFEFGDEGRLKRSSILKASKPRLPLQDVNLGFSDEDTTEVRRRRVSFGVKKIKQFNTDADTYSICVAPEEEVHHSASSDSSFSVTAGGFQDLSGRAFIHGRVSLRPQSQELNPSGYDQYSTENIPPVGKSSYSRRNVACPEPSSLDMTCPINNLSVGETAPIDGCVDVQGLCHPQARKTPEMSPYNVSTVSMELTTAGTQFRPPPGGLNEYSNATKMSSSMSFASSCNKIDDSIEDVLSTSGNSGKRCYDKDDLRSHYSLDSMDLTDIVLSPPVKKFHPSLSPHKPSPDFSFHYQAKDGNDSKMDETLITAQANASLVSDSLLIEAPVLNVTRSSPERVPVPSLQYKEEEDKEEKRRKEEAEISIESLANHSKPVPVNCSVLRDVSMAFSESRGFVGDNLSNIRPPVEMQNNADDTSWDGIPSTIPTDSLVEETCEIVQMCETSIVNSVAIDAVSPRPILPDLSTTVTDEPDPEPKVADDSRMDETLTAIAQATSVSDCSDINSPVKPPLAISCATPIKLSVVEIDVSSIQEESKPQRPCSPADFEVSASVNQEPLEVLPEAQPKTLTSPPVLDASPSTSQESTELEINSSPPVIEVSECMYHKSTEAQIHSNSPVEISATIVQESAKVEMYSSALVEEFVSNIQEEPGSQRTSSPDVLEVSASVIQESSETQHEAKSSPPVFEVYISMNQDSTEAEMHSSPPVVDVIAPMDQDSVDVEMHSNPPAEKLNVNHIQEKPEVQGQPSLAVEVNKCLIQESPVVEISSIPPVEESNACNIQEQPEAKNESNQTINLHRFVPHICTFLGNNYGCNYSDDTGVVYAFDYRLYGGALLLNFKFPYCFIDSKTPVLEAYLSLGEKGGAADKHCAKYLFKIINKKWLSENFRVIGDISKVLAAIEKRMKIIDQFHKSLSHFLLRYECDIVDNRLNFPFYEYHSITGFNISIDISSCDLHNMKINITEYFGQVSEVVIQAMVHNICKTDQTFHDFYRFMTDFYVNKHKKEKEKEK